MVTDYKSWQRGPLTRVSTVDAHGHFHYAGLPFRMYSSWSIPQNKLGSTPWQLPLTPDFHDKYSLRSFFSAPVSICPCIIPMFPYSLVCLHLVTFYFGTKVFVSLHHTGGSGQVVQSPSKLQKGSRARLSPEGTVHTTWSDLEKSTASWDLRCPRWQRRCCCY